jgi:hypothetical protein
MTGCDFLQSGGAVEVASRGALQSQWKVANNFQRDEPKKINTDGQTRKLSPEEQQQLYNSNEFAKSRQSKVEEDRIWTTSVNKAEKEYKEVIMIIILKEEKGRERKQKASNETNDHQQSNRDTQMIKIVEQNNSNFKHKPNQASKQNKTKNKITVKKIARCSSFHNQTQKCCEVLSRFFCCCKRLTRSRCC